MRGIPELILLGEDVRNLCQNGLKSWLLKFRLKSLGLPLPEVATTVVCFLFLSIHQLKTEIHIHVAMHNLIFI